MNCVPNLKASYQRIMSYKAQKIDELSMNHPQNHPKKTGG